MNTLYKRSSNGKIEQWTITVQDDYFFTASGNVGGAITISAKTFCTGKNVGKKNESTAQEQALLEAQAKYYKKLKSGYKASIEDVDTITKLVPQLAKKYEDYKHKLTFPVVESAKIDGNRILASKDGLFTRTGEVYVSIPHISSALESVFVQYPNLVLDGEAYNLALADNLSLLQKI